MDKIFLIRVKRKQKFNRQFFACGSINEATEFTFHELIMKRYFDMELPELDGMQGLRVSYTKNSETELKGIFHAYWVQPHEHIEFEIEEQ